MIYVQGSKRIDSSLENQIKDGKGKFLFVHFKKVEDIHIPVSCRTRNDEGNQKENNAVHAKRDCE